MKYEGIRWRVEKYGHDKEELIKALKEYVEDKIDMAKGKIDAMIETVEQPAKHA